MNIEPLEERITAMLKGSPLHGFDRSSHNEDEFFDALGRELGLLWQACRDLASEIDRIKRSH